jgi:cellulose synthase/poly-beta-1,6-N-acetylglucosamine synthase-like glycosyltransferase
MSGVKISLVTTCLNEISNIEKFLNSVISQSKLPDELIIVDGGSSDGTIDSITKFKKWYKWIKLIVSKGVSRGKGRNLAIEKSKNEMIAVADAGCILNKNWLKNLITPFKKGYDVVVGYYEPFHENDFQFFAGKLLVSKNIEEIARISSRSLAFRKDVWEKTGGYEENVDVGEDTLFHWKITKHNYKMVFQKNAIVYWIMPKNSKELFKKFFKYGAGYWQTVVLKEFRKFLLLIFGTYSYVALLIFSLLSNILYLTVFLFLILSLGLIYTGVKGVLTTKKINALLYMPYLILLKNLSFVLGFSMAKLKSD